MIWITLGAGTVVLLIAFAVGLSIGKHRVVDIAWGFGFAAIALTSFGLSAGHGDTARRALITAAQRHLGGTAGRAHRVAGAGYAGGPEVRNATREGLR